MILRFDNAGAAGIINDLPPHDLPPEAWSDGKNVRFDERSVSKFLGTTNIFDPPTVAPYWLLPVQSAGVNYWIYAGLVNVYVTDGTLHKNISKVGDYSGSEARGWTGGTLNGIPFLTNGVEPPQMWNPINFATPGLLSDLSNFPALDKCDILRAYKNFLVALRVSESGVSNPHMVKWSHPADSGGVPSSWDEADATVLAGEVQLAQTPGHIVDCWPLRDINVIYKEDAIHAMQFVGGIHVHRFYPITEHIGALSRRCMKQHGSNQVAFGFEDIVIHDGQQVQSLVKNRMRQWVENQLDPDTYGLSFITVERAKQEMWFCFPRVGSVRPDVALVWNIRENTFGVRDLPLVSDIQWGVTDTSPDLTWDADSGTWNADTEAWDIRTFSPANKSMLGAVPGVEKLIRFDDSNQEAGVNMTSYVERTGLAMVGQDRQGQFKADFERVKIVRSVRPRIAASGIVKVSVGSQYTRDEAITWEGPYDFDPAVDFKVDFNTSGRLIGVRFESETDLAWTLFGYDLEIELMGWF
jgi:hypothetical protein